MNAFEKHKKEIALRSMLHMNILENLSKIFNNIKTKLMSRILWRHNVIITKNVTWLFGSI